MPCTGSTAADAPRQCAQGWCGSCMAVRMHPPSLPGLPPPAAEASRVLLVAADAPGETDALRDALDESGYAVTHAATGEAALACLAQAAAQAGPDLVLLDVGKPGIDAFEVARVLEADAATAAIPVIFMVAIDDTEAVVGAFGGGGVVDYVVKPVRLRELIARMEGHLRSARAQGQARRALDAFGHASLVVRERDGRRLWQTALARELLQRHFPAVPEVLTPPPVLAWVAREALRRRVGAQPHGLIVGPGAQRLSLTLHASGEGDDGEWLLVLREDSPAAQVQALARAFPALTAREAEVLYWVAQGKTNRDIAAILELSPRTVHKHLEHVFAKLGVETRTAAAALALAPGPAAAPPR